MAEIRVLIIDDEPSILRSMEMVFAEEEGFVVATLQDVRKWSELIPTFRPDVVLVDFKMPHMSGAEFLAALNTSEFRSRIQAVVLFSASPLGRERAMAMGADEFFVKPFNIDRLIECTKKLAVGSQAKPFSRLV